MEIIDSDVDTSPDLLIKPVGIVDWSGERDLFTPNRKDRLPDGLEYRQIAPLIGVSHTRVQQIEREALAKLRKLCRRADVSLDDLI